MKYLIKFEKRALENIRKITKSGNKSDKNNLEIILEELESHPYSGIGRPEELKHHLSGYWSRRINKKDRLIYQVIEEPEKWVVIISALGHY